MFRQVTLEEFKIAALQKKRAVVFQEFPCDDITPTHAFIALDIKRGGVLLESAIKDQQMGRYSLIAFEPFAEFKSKGRSDELDPLAPLRSAINDLRVASNPNYPPLVGGAIGFISYDAIRLFEEISDRQPDQELLPDLYFLFHTVHIAFDHAKGSLLISLNVELTEDIEDDYVKAVKKIAEIRTKLYRSNLKNREFDKEALQNCCLERATIVQAQGASEGKNFEAKPTQSKTDFSSCFGIKSPIKNKEKAAPLSASSFVEELNDVEFCARVEKAKDYIRKGDAFQIVLSRAFRCPFHANPFDVFRALRMTNPAPFMFYLETDEFAVAGSSPERLVKLEKGKLQTMPIAGSRPRTAGEEDKTVLELLQDPKEDAEHMMLVDLGRNDLGIVAKIGSVKVQELKAARYFPHVIHLVSQIEAELAEEFDALDALKAVFPAGTLTGAPKIRAMEIIDELEASRRGLYGGAICTIDNNGYLDSCIAIRTAFFKDGIATVRAGAGIVFDSDPQKEADETRAKAKGVIHAIQLALEGVL